MKNIISTIFTVALTLSLAMVSASCDQVERVASGMGGSKSSSSSSSEDSSSPDTFDSLVDRESKADSEDEGDSGDDSEVIQVAQADTSPDLQKIRLSAFTDFNCTSAWTNRDGGWGLRAGSGSGECSVKFPGGDGNYRVTLMAQLEFDGNPKFRIEVDGSPIAVGSYPMSMGKLICDCPNWRVKCPDRIVPIDAGVHEISQGSMIKFVAAEVYPCGGNHGAYAKWHELVFTPQE